MAEKQPTTVFDIETLNAVAARLFDRADEIENICQGLTDDLTLAARIADKLASLRFRVGEIAVQCLAQDPGATHRDLVTALDDAAREG
jgi:hypothetical protein